MTKFIVIEWIDGSWKTTQVKELKKHYENEGKKVLLLDYPRYDDESCIGVKRYLSWEYGHVNNVSIYQSSLFYAIDRLDNHLKNIKKIWNDYDIVLANRYTTSNLIHQGGKLLENLSDKGYIEDTLIVDETLTEFKNWLETLEYRDLSLPKPDRVIFLDVPETVSLKNIDIRWNKKDWHENIAHLQWAYKSANFYIDKIKSWKRINCLNENKQMKTISEILSKILKNL